MLEMKYLKEHERSIQYLKTRGEGPVKHPAVSHSQSHVQSEEEGGHIFCLSCPVLILPFLQHR